LKIETKKCWANGDIETTCPYTKEFICPAPDLEELLEYALNVDKCRWDIRIGKSLRMEQAYIVKAFDLIEKDEILITAETLIQALANLLLKLKEEEYEV
jgi:hypothetical protein